MTKKDFVKQYLEPMVKALNKQSLQTFSNGRYKENRGRQYCRPPNFYGGRRNNNNGYQNKE